MSYILTENGLLIEEENGTGDFLYESGPVVTPLTGMAWFEYTYQAQIIVPNSGTLVMELFHPTNVALTPLTAAIAFTGGSPPVQTLFVPSPLDAHVAFNLSTPLVTMGAQIMLNPLTGSLGVSGTLNHRVTNNIIFVPTAATNTWAWDSTLMTFDDTAAFFDGSISVVAAFGLTGYAPQVLAGRSFQPLTGAAMAFSGYAPQLAINTTVNAAALAFVGAAPVLGKAISITPSSGALATIGASPAALQFTFLTNTASLALSGTVPVWGIGVTPATGNLVLSGNPVGIGLVGIITPQAGALGTAGAAPALGAPTGITPATGALGVAGTTVNESMQITITANLGGAAFTLYAPLVGQVGAITPQAGALGFLGANPAPLDLAFSVPSGALAMTGQAPAPLILGTTIQASSAGAQLSGAAPLLNTTVNVLSGALGVQGNAPFSLVPVIANPVTGALGVNGNQAISFIGGPPLVEVIPITLVQYSVTILFIAPGSNAMPTPTINVNETNSLIVQVGPFLDINSVPFIPQALQWLVWDDTNQIQIQGFTNLLPALSVQFEIPGGLNLIENPNNLTERHMVLIQTTLPGGEVRYDVAYYNVLSIPDVPLP